LPSVCGCGGAQQSYENAQAAAIERAARAAGVQGAQAFGAANNVGLAAERRLQAGQMNAVFTREIRRKHGAVKGRQQNLIEQPEVHRGQVAVGR